MTDAQNPVHGGSIACNPGLRNTAKLSPSRAIYEQVSNALNATADSKDIGVVEVFPCFTHPLSLGGEGDDTSCFAVVSNSYLDPSNYREAINYGRTRGTDQGNDKQAVGNDQGIGMKESCFSVGGNPGLLSIKKVADAKYRLTGWIVHDDLMNLRVQMGLSSQDELSYATFKVDIKVLDDGTPKGELVYPKLNKDGEYYDKVGLFCTGLPFCAEGTHYTSKADGYLESDESYVENKPRFVKACELLFNKTMQWSKDKLQTISRQPESRRYHDLQTVEDSMQELTIAFCHSVPNQVFFRAKDDNPMNMTAEFDVLKECHQWCTKGDAYPLSTSLALQINWPYYDALSKTALVFVNGIDIRSANVYLPLVRASERIAERKASYESQYTDFTIAGNGTSFGSISFCNVVKSNVNIGNTIVDVEKYAHGMPTVEWDDDDNPKQTWNGWDVAATREPTLGVFITRGSGVINPLGAVEYWFDCGKYIGGQGAAPDRIRSSMQFALTNLESARYKSRIVGSHVIYQLCNALNIRFGTKNHAKKTTDYFPTSDLEKHIETKITKLLSIPNPFDPETRLSNVYTDPWIEAMTMTNPMNAKKDFYPQSESSEACKYVVQRMFGANSCGIFDINPDVFSLNQEKTLLTPVQMHGSNTIASSIFAASSAFSLSYELPPELEYRAKFIDQNADKFKLMFVDTRDDNPNHSRASRAQPNSNTGVTDHTNTDVADHTNMPTNEWLDFVHESLENSADYGVVPITVYNQTADGSKWRFEAVLRPNLNGGPKSYDYYYTHYTHSKFFNQGGKIRSKQGVKWFTDFLAREFKFESDSDMNMCRKLFKTAHFNRLCREQAIGTCLQTDDAARADESSAMEVGESIYGKRAGAQPPSQASAAGAQVHARVADDASGGASSRKRKVIESPCEAMVKAWFNEHPYDNPAFVYAQKITADQARIKKTVEILGRISDNVGSPNNFLNYEDAVCLLSNFMCETSGGLGLRRMNQATAATGVCKRTRLDDLIDPQVQPAQQDAASSSSGVTSNDLLNAEAGVYSISELD